MENKGRLSRLTSLLRRRGIVLPSFEIYGGVSGLVDYGPVGARIKRRVVNSWIEHWGKVPNVVEIDSPTITPESVLAASGHVGEFNDKMSECKSCGGVFRSDHLLGSLHENPDTLSSSELDELISKRGVKCPSCDSKDWLGASSMNLMFQTSIGAMGGSRTAYMRPETAQGMFMLYPALYRHFRQRLPFGAMQTGKGYRNEISPRQGMIRLREFNMAELEYFIDPEEPPAVDLSRWERRIHMLPDPDGPHPSEVEVTIEEAFESGIVKHPTVAWFLAMTMHFLEDVGVEPSKVRFRQHASSEMAHYASDCWDCELSGEHGWIEVVGIANRTCHDLESHEKGSKSGLLKGWRSFENPVKESREVLKPDGAVIGPAFRERASDVSAALSELKDLPERIPFTLSLADGTTVEIEEGMVTRVLEESTVSGEYFTPHVIEPAFGIDRIIWHILDHNYLESEKDGDEYTILTLEPSLAPYDVVVLPLFAKNGMDMMAREVLERITSISGIIAEIDTSRSIGRRYARADEIGVPWAVTIDHQSLDDATVTVRRRDDQKQIRVDVDALIESINSDSLQSLF
ncbi:MAG: glycine--tRNA ligase [Candidatus Thalassarchaeaceae archaeon]